MYNIDSLRGSNRVLQSPVLAQIFNDSGVGFIINPSVEDIRSQLVVKFAILSLIKSAIIPILVWSGGTEEWPPAVVNPISKFTLPFSPIEGKATALSLLIISIEDPPSSKMAKKESGPYLSKTTLDSSPAPLTPPISSSNPKEMTIVRLAESNGDPISSVEIVGIFTAPDNFFNESTRNVSEWKMYSSVELSRRKDLGLSVSPRGQILLRFKSSCWMLGEIIECGSVVIQLV
ncbi:hypothetical protein WICPIJ_009724 [Wickerhamomyces pijperi]|uniref:Uncharacterized protein n=1 Tax=Wickerhamomyces pijperi TaxID=599730 RepID=A0A9P8PK60_WICPI|nr:hypothetical protein WICPIJ_009724 [Wickerhamomyces pijperi]